jgi:hypothetical protein
MRKLMLLVAMLAMMFVVAAPALAQTATAGDIDGSINDSFNLDIQFVDSDVVQTVALDQFGGGAIATGDSSAASVDNSIIVEQTAVVAGLDSVAYLP